MLRSLTIVFAVALSASIAVSPAAATEPTKTTFSVIAVPNVLTDVCAFPVNVASDGTGFIIDYFNESGALTRSFIHLVEQDTFTANGKTLVGIPFTYNNEYIVDSTGNLTHVYVTGVYEKIPLPDGSVFISAGRTDNAKHGFVFIISPDKGNPGNVAGFCAAHAP